MAPLATPPAGTLAKATAAFCLLELVFLIVLPSVTVTQLDPAGGSCGLNLSPGQVCDFVYVSTGFGFLFSLTLLAYAVLTLRKSPAYQPGVVGMLALFAAFWFMVLSITITIRGGQAADAGEGSSAPRTAVIAISWLVTILYFFTLLSSCVDGYAHSVFRRATKSNDSKAQLLAMEHERPAFVSTQALGHTPIV